MKVFLSPTQTNIAIKQGRAAGLGAEWCKWSKRTLERIRINPA